MARYRHREHVGPEYKNEAGRSISSAPLCHCRSLASSTLSRSRRGWRGTVAAVDSGVRLGTCGTEKRTSKEPMIDEDCPDSRLNAALS